MYTPGKLFRFSTEFENGMMNAPVCTTLIAWSRMEMNWSSSGIRMDEYLLAERTAACIDSSTAWLSTSPDCCSWSISASSISDSNCTLEVEGNSESGSAICTSFTSLDFASSLAAVSFCSPELLWNQIRSSWILYPFPRMIKKIGRFFFKKSIDEECFEPRPRFVYQSCCHSRIDLFQYLFSRCIDTASIAQ